MNLKALYLKEGFLLINCKKSYKMYKSNKQVFIYQLKQGDRQNVSRRKTHL